MINQKILTLGTLFDYIKKYYPELKFWDGFSKHEIRDNSKSYKHRQGMPNEIRIEFDSKDINKNFEDVNKTCINLWNSGYNFAVFYVEDGRSPHIHIYDVDELDNFPIEKRNYYRERFLKKYCPEDSNPDFGLCDETHLCALEFANHFKYNKPKQLLHLFFQGALNNQGMDNEIFCDIVFKKEKTRKKKLLTKKRMKFGEMMKQKPRKLILSMLTFEAVFEKYGIEYKGKMALCPFHVDSNKSLSFSNEKGLWKCFGCNESGDTITLIKKLEELRNGR